MVDDDGKIALFFTVLDDQGKRALLRLYNDRQSW